ncbi:Nrap protein [Trichodelitschia bisporula]|uniref:U3 small nucleolar RNA-associated protein 22 n=1 Tax=Trichodelitschia bisporula TaxID=703511 RepID=A0A6G1HVW9_9PEZI|nr:Nrap protein [Trichodelitschia bisporula]
MAPPAIKRRKLSHTPSDGDTSDGSEQSGFPSEEEHDSADDLEGVSDDSGMEDASSNDEDEEMEEDIESEPVSPIAKEKLAVKPAAKVPEKQKATAEKPKPRHTQPSDALTGTGYTGEVFRSNMFKLQVDELLEQVRPKHGKKEAAVERVLRALKTIIEQIPARDPTSVVEAEKALLKKDRIAVPFPNPRPAEDAKYKLAYSKPAQVSVAGSYPLKTTTGSSSDLVLDIIVTMPQDIFQEKDYMNFRYFYKRAFYLACLAAGIKANKQHAFDLKFDYLHGNRLLPILVVTPDEKDAGFKVVILPAVLKNVFPVEKLLPTVNCVRPKVLGEEKDEPLRPTPFYNASIRVDSLALAYLKLQHDAAKQCEAYKDACVLGRIWLRQRGFSGRMRNGGFGNFEWGVLIALLLQGGGPKGMPAFSPGYSSYQLFKATLQYLATKDFVKNPQVVGGSLALPQEKGPVFFDVTRSSNVLFKMSPWSYKLLQYEARTAVAMLSDSVFDHFDATFIMRVDQPLYRYDTIVEIPVLSLVPVAEREMLEERLSSRCQELYTTLTRGLGDRVKLIQLHMPEEENWALGTRAHAISNDSKVMIGFVVDAASYNRTVDHGPAAENKKEAASFRKFWGEKAELRRFKDGSILESLVWSTKEGSSIFRQIISYLVERHFGKDAAADMSYTGDQETKLVPSAGQPAGIAPFHPIMMAFQALEKDLRALEELPLQIRHILPASPELSYSSVEIPFIPGRTRMTIPADVILQFESSARWPDDLAAIQGTKIAFLLNLATELEAHAAGMTARVGLENETASLQNQSFLDVIYPTGAAFRLRLLHDREPTLLTRRLKDKTLSQSVKTAAAAALAAFKRTFVHLPAHTQAIQTLATRFPALSTAMRLFKRWIAAHRLAPHIAPQAAELLAARAFAAPYPWPVPSTGTTGFLRTLAFVARWDWRVEPWIVDLSVGGGPGVEGGFDAQAVQAARLRFEAWRKVDPGMNRVVWFLGSSVDGEGVAWTEGRVPKVVAGRVRALAKAAVGVINDRERDVGTLFGGSVTEYDFVIRLADVGDKGKRKEKEKFKNLAQQAGEEDVGYDPLGAFADEIQRLFGHAAVFFWDADRRDCIAGLWNPLQEERAWKLKLDYSTVPVEKGEGVVARINREGILNEIARLGGGLVKKVDVKGK